MDHSQMPGMNHAAALGPAEALLMNQASGTSMAPAGVGLSITHAAAALGVTRNTLSELVNGRRGISPEMAVRLSKVFGGTDEGWLVQQAQYDLAQVRRDRMKLKKLELV